MVCRYAFGLERCTIAHPVNLVKGGTYRILQGLFLFAIASLAFPIFLIPSFYYTTPKSTRLKSIWGVDIKWWFLALAYNIL